MCTFISTLPTQSKTAAVKKPANTFLSLKPCPPDDPRAIYRFRLLNFASKNSARDYPFIEKYVHTVWGKTEDGKPIIESSVVCPVTKFMPWNGDRYECPICKYSNNNFVLFRDSGFRDKIAGERSRKFARKFEANIPVYVVNDPNYEGNNNKFKVITFTDKTKYNEFKKLIQAKLRECGVFNGGPAVDLCIRVDRVTEFANKGEPNEFSWTKNVISKMLFSSKPYELPGITKEAVDEFPFDEQYFVTSTEEEIKEFSKKYLQVQMDDVDFDEIAVHTAATENTIPNVVVDSNVKKSVVSNPDVKSVVEKDDLPGADDIDALFDQIDDDTDASDSSGSKSADITKSEGKKSSSDDLEIDIDALLDSIE